jgi:hypothetical protein
VCNKKYVIIGSFCTVTSVTLFDHLRPEKMNRRKIVQNVQNFAIGAKWRLLQRFVIGSEDETGDRGPKSDT